MLMLFRQFSGEYKREFPTREKVEEWMDRWPTGLDPRIIKLREENRERILKLIIEKIDKGEIKDNRYFFDKGMSREQKYLRTLEWWKERLFHLRFAVRSPDLLNEFLGNSLDPDTMKVLYDAEKKGIPFFVNPYYLSLLHVRVPYFAVGADLAIRYYVVYSQQLGGFACRRRLVLGGARRLVGLFLPGLRAPDLGRTKLKRRAGE